MSLNPDGKWHQGTQDCGHIGSSHLQGSATSGHHPPLHSLAVVSSAPTLASLLSPDPGLSHSSPHPPHPGAGPQTKAVPPQVVGDGNGHGAPGQVGQQQQGGSLLMGMSEQSRAHHQPEEQQQVQQGLGGGRAVRRAALGIALDLSAAPWSQRAKFRVFCAPRGSSGQPAPPPRPYLPAPDGCAALPCAPCFEGRAASPPPPLPTAELWCLTRPRCGLPTRGSGHQLMA